MENIHHTLKKKGWSSQEIRDSLRILKKAKKQRESYIKFFDRSMTLFVSIAALLANTVVAIFLLPFLIFMDSSLLFFVIIIAIGLTIGTAISFLIYEIEHTHKHHKKIFLVIIPAITVIIIAIMVMISNRVVDQIALIKLHQNPIVISFLYAISFVFPYLFTLRRK